jgi:hypothetical protein
MKPTVFQVLFAEDVLAKAWTGGFVVAAMTGLTIQSLPAFAVLGLSFHAVLLAAAILLGGVAAYFASLILGSCVLPPVYRMGERRNGAPFEAGDLVEVLKKPHRGRVARIVSAGNPQYGATVLFTEGGEHGEPLNLAWLTFRRLPHIT